MISFVKYHGCGNDFILLPYQKEWVCKEVVQAMCHRHCGIGADGCIFIEKDPLRMHFYNQDGTRASMCGNGLRCLCAYAYEQGWMKQHDHVWTDAGKLAVSVLDTKTMQIEIDMGCALLDGTYCGKKDASMIWNEEILVNEQLFHYDAFYMTTPHLILQEPVSVDMQDAIIEKLQKEKRFPDGINVNFIKILDTSHMQVITYEKGVGYTCACGSGCCACVYDAYLHERCEHTVTISFPYGDLQVRIDVQGHIWLKGPAQSICSGTWHQKNIDKGEEHRWKKYTR